jgi:hypothetical protein
MSERYEKLGASVRLEASARGRSVITLREGGFAEQSANRFSCGPLPPDHSIEPPHAKLTSSIDEAVTGMARGLADVERLTLVEGLATHRLVAGRTRRTWEESNGRLFATLVRQPCGRRAALSMGAQSLDAIDLAPVRSICQALALPETLAPSHAPSLTLEPWVAAGLVRAMADERALPASGLRLTQAPPPGTRDGRGAKPRRKVVRQSRERWPDMFRPSYRFAPIAVPLHVDLAGARDDDAGLDFVAVALASSWVLRAGALHARVWIVDRDAGRVSFARVAVDPSAMSGRTVHAAGDPVWFPEGAGAWGRRLTLSQPVVLVRSA